MRKDISLEIAVCALAAAFAPGRGRAVARQVIEACRGGGRDAILAQRELLNPRFLSQAEEIVTLAEYRQLRVVLLGEGDYPERLAEIPDPPPILFARGSIERVFSSLAKSFSVSIVGARRSTAYGNRIARQLAAEVVEAGGIVVSGLARGIDTAAHEGALSVARERGVSAGIAVLGSGLLRVYPAENRDLCDFLCDQGGCVLSEYAPLESPTQFSFPERNRIVSGLSDAVVVVEAGERSGALITARLAAEQGRDVFAVPGQIDSGASVGSNELIMQGAIPCRGFKDILDNNPRLRGLVSSPAVLVGSRVQLGKPCREQVLGGLSDSDARFAASILSLIDSRSLVEFEALIVELNAEAPRLRATLIELELAGLVFSVSGGRFSTSESIDM